MIAYLSNLLYLSAWHYSNNTISFECPGMILYAIVQKHMGDKSSV
jgi:hypothetical protein